MPWQLSAMPPVPAHCLAWRGTPLVLEIQRDGASRIRLVSHSNEYVGLLRERLAQHAGCNAKNVRMFYSGESLGGATHDHVGCCVEPNWFLQGRRNEHFQGAWQQQQQKDAKDQQQKDAKDQQQPDPKEQQKDAKTSTGKMSAAAAAFVPKAAHSAAAASPAAAAAGCIYSPGRTAQLWWQQTQEAVTCGWTIGEAAYRRHHQPGVSRNAAFRGAYDLGCCAAAAAGAWD